MISENVCGTRLLQDSVREVFESMIFMDVEPREMAGDFLAGETCMMSSVAFNGDYKGVLTLICSQSCASTVAMNMLAMDDADELSESEVADTLGEVANMTMGTVKSKLYDVVGELSVSVPMVVSGSKLLNELGDTDRKVSSRVNVGGEFDLEMHLIYKG